MSQRDWDDTYLINAARQIHADGPAVGYRFIADDLADHGIVAGENRVARLSRQERIWSVFSKKRGLTRRSGHRSMTNSSSAASPRPAPTNCG